MARGRPRELPPRLDPAVAVDAEREHVQPQPRPAVLAAARHDRRVAKQQQVVRDQARMRGRRQSEQLAMAYEHAQLAVEKTLRRYEREAAKKKEELQRLRQLRVAVEMGEECALSDAELRRLRDVAGLGTKKPRLSKSDERVIQELGGSETQRDIANRVGASQSTVSRHLRASHAANRTQQTTRHGRKPKLTKQMLIAAARFQFLFGTTSSKHTAAFVQLAFGVSVSVKTIRRHLKGVAGFRLGDFRRFPRDRNSDLAISQRADYAETMANKYGQNSLYEAIYYDELKLTRKTTRHAWSIGGWTPSVPDEFDTDSPQQITLMYAASPSFGLVYYEIVEGVVTSDTVMNFMVAMVTAYTRNATRTSVRAFITDHARIRHTDDVTEYFHGEFVSQLFRLEFLPIHSPFLNPLEEVFGLIKARIWRRRSNDNVKDESKAMLKRSLVEQVSAITVHDVRQCYSHVERFINYARDRTPVCTQHLYESTHSGDELELCPMLPETVETLLASYVPNTFEEFTPEANALVERAFGCPRLTMDVINSIMYSRSDENEDEDDT
ncbi:hypothetical protein BBJ28_00004152 [Nothophytophthora sp. Chile5]|nr:hypothetical protein BBJ28_00004152 [Nothophytophthora sp. Chile5]